LRHLLVAVVAGVALYLLTEALSPYDNLQLATMAYYFVAVAGLTVLTGQNGQISLGHGALMAVGAYATVKIQDAVSWPLAVVLLAASLVTAVSGALAGAAAARLRGPYLAGATLALAVGLPALATKFSGFLGGSNGLTVTPPIPPASLGATFPLERWQAWIACLAALATYVVLANLVRSGYGRAFRAVRDDEVAAQLAGFHVARTQIIAFVVSAACAGPGCWSWSPRWSRREPSRSACRSPCSPGSSSGARAASSAPSGARPPWCSSPRGPTTPARRCRSRPTFRPTSRWPSTASCSSG
jgi:branched-chain amino acid transport system permease protein